MHDPQRMRREEGEEGVDEGEEEAASGDDEKPSECNGSADGGDVP